MKTLLAKWGTPKKNILKTTLGFENQFKYKCVVSHQKEQL
jgi:hypothetical protein